MKKLTPIIALLGLLVVMVFPAPGYTGVAIGGTCCLVIVGWTVARLMNRVADRIAVRWQSRRKMRQVHAGSGIARRTF